MVDVLRPGAADEDPAGVVHRREPAAAVAAAATRALIADDHADVLTALRLLLKNEGYRTDAVSSPAAALDALAREPFDLLLVDLNYTRDTTSGQEGLGLLARIRELDPDVPVIAMTAWGSIGLAIEVMRIGVDDFVQKPWDNATLLGVVRTHVEAGRARRRERRVASQSADARTQEGAAAREMQRTLLPRQLPSLAGCELSVEWRPIGDVGGDFYDMMPLDGHRTAICIGDVAGKGLPAALLMANVQAFVRAAASALVPPSELCTTVNRALCGRMAAGRFVTFFYGVLDPATRLFAYACAGHSPPLLVGRTGRVARLGQGGPVLGILPDGVYEEGVMMLSHGDRLVLFTDGITEAAGPDDEEFGEPRLVDLVRAHRAASAAALRARIVEAASEFCAGRFRDDVTVIVAAIT